MKKIILFILILTQIAIGQHLFARGGFKEEMIIKGRYLEVKKTSTGKIVSYNPDSGRRRASYSYYRFDYDHFVDKVGVPKKVKRVKLKIKLIKKTKENYKPKDPNAPSPHGGFNYTYYDCEIVKVYGKKSGNKKSQQIKLKIKGNYIIVDSRGKKRQVIYTPNSDRKMAYYTDYIFNYDEFVNKVGDPKKVGEVTLLIEILTKNNETYYPKKGMQSPVGGFSNTKYRCKIIKKLK